MNVLDFILTSIYLINKIFIYFYLFIYFNIFFFFFCSIQRRASYPQQWFHRLVRLVLPRLLAPDQHSTWDSDTQLMSEDTPKVLNCLNSPHPNWALKKLTMKLSGESHRQTFKFLYCSDCYSLSLPRWDLVF